MRYNCLSRKKPNAYKFNESKIKSKYFEQITSKGLFWLAKNDVIILNVKFQDEKICFQNNF